MSAPIEDYSIVLQHKLERMLAGIGLGDPELALEKFRGVERVMIDQLAINFLRRLAELEPKIRDLDPRDRIEQTVAIAFEFDAPALLKAFNEASPGIYAEKPIELIADDLAHRIKLQSVTRNGISDLLQFTASFLKGEVYA